MAESVQIIYDIDTRPIVDLAEAQRQAAEATEQHAAQMRAEADAAEAARKETEKLAREQEAQAKATAKAKEELEKLADAGDLVAQANKKFADQKKKIDALREATGDETLATKALAAAQKQLEADLEAAAAASNEMARKSGEAAESMGDFSSRMGAAAGAADVLAPGLGGVLQPMADLAGGFEAAGQAAAASGTSIAALLAPIAAVGAAIGLLAAGYLAADRAVQQINEQWKLQKTLAAELRGTYQGLEDAQQALALATGKLSEAEDAELTIRRQIQRAAQDALTAHDEEVEALKTSIEENKKYLNVQRGLAVALVATQNLMGGWAVTLARATARGVSFTEVIQEDVRELNSMFDAVTGLESGTQAAQNQIQTYNEAGRDQVQVLKDTRDALIATDKATRAAADGQEELEKAIALTNSMMALEQQTAQENSTRFYAMLDELLAAEQANYAARDDLLMGYTQKLDRQRNAELEGIRDRYQQEYLALEGNLQAQELLTENYHGFVAALDAKYETQRTQFLDQEAQKRADAEMAYQERVAEQKRQLDDAWKRGEEEKRQITKETTIAATQLYGDLYGALLEGIATVAEATGASEQEIFAIRKAAALAQSVIQGAGAILTALQTPYPLTIPAVALAGATATAQIATIAASQPPSYRSGGMIGSSDLALTSPMALPDARLISAEIGEGILNRQGMSAVGGEAGLDEINNGISPAPVQVNLKLRHKTLDTVIAELGQRGSQYRASRTGNSGRKNPYVVR